mmetsp:Transcript_47654/g.137164  ORF Transcript_47654/g.137164 Transcript_47654/m.137164 type:complete len:234 (+) Transcript_47654:430-1131(+)
MATITATCAQLCLQHAPEPAMVHVRRVLDVLLGEQGADRLIRHGWGQLVLHDHEMSGLLPPRVSPTEMHAQVQEVLLWALLEVVQDYTDISTGVLGIIERGQLVPCGCVHHGSKDGQLIVGVGSCQREQDPRASPADKLQDPGAVLDAAVRDVDQIRRPRGPVVVPHRLVHLPDARLMQEELEARQEAEETENKARYTNDKRGADREVHFLAMAFAVMVRGQRLEQQAVEDCD